jgi:hypothetical protein
MVTYISAVDLMTILRTIYIPFLIHRNDCLKIRHFNALLHVIDCYIVPQWYLLAGYAKQPSLSFPARVEALDAHEQSQSDHVQLTI